MLYQKFEKYLERKNPDLVKKVTIIKAGDTLQGADALEGEPNKPPKENKPLKNGKQAQVKEQEEMPKVKFPGTWKKNKKPKKLDQTEEKKLNKTEEKKESLWFKFLEKKQAGSVVEKPATEIIADYPFKSPDAPPEAKTKGKNWDTKAPKASKPLPYKCAGKDPGQQTAKEGLGDLGSIPKEEIKLTAGDSQYLPGGKTVGDYTTKTEEFLQKTKDMPINEFVKVIREETHDATLPQTIQRIVSLSKNENVLRNLIVEFKKHNLFESLLENIMNFPEAYQVLCDLLADEQKGLSRCNALVRAMNEAANLPNNEDDYEDDDYEDDEDDYEDDEDEDDEDDEDEDDEDEDDEDEDDEMLPKGRRLAMDHLIHALNQLKTE